MSAYIYYCERENRQKYCSGKLTLHIGELVVVGAFALVDVHCARFPRDMCSRAQGSWCIWRRKCIICWCNAATAAAYAHRPSCVLRTYRVFYWSTERGKYSRSLCMRVAQKKAPEKVQIKCASMKRKVGAASRRKRRRTYARRRKPVTSKKQWHVTQWTMTLWWHGWHTFNCYATEYIISTHKKQRIFLTKCLMLSFFYEPFCMIFF